MKNGSHNSKLLWSTGDRCLEQLRHLLESKISFIAKQWQRPISVSDTRKFPLHVVEDTWRWQGMELTS